MILKYGSYSHPSGECSFTRTVSPKLSEAQQVISEVVRWDIRGEIIADGVASIVDRVAEIDAAYAIQGQDLSLLDDSGNLVVVLLRSATSVNGVRSTRPNLPQGEGAEWATGLKFSASFEAEYTSSLQSGLVSFQETLSFSGGGPVYVWRRPLNAPPIKQTVSPYSPYRLTQSGRAVGRYTYPSPPGPLFAADLWEGPSPRYTGPNLTGGQLLNYTTEWNYVMESVSPLQGLPTLPG